MTKEGLVEAIANKCECSRMDAKKCLDATIEAISMCMKKGDSINLTGFGTFKVVNRAARMGINPQTGEKLQIPATKAPVFRASRVLKMMMKK